MVSILGLQKGLMQALPATALCPSLAQFLPVPAPSGYFANFRRHGMAVGYYLFYSPHIE